MSNSDEDADYEVQVDKLITTFDNIFRTSAGEPAQLSRDIFSVMQAHPTLTCAHALAYALTSQSEQNPKGIYALVQGTAAVFTSYPEANEIIIDEPDATAGSGPISFHDELYVTLLEYFSFGMGDNAHESGSEVIPSSVTLQTALLSGSVVATGLMEDSSNSLWFVLEGLRLSDRDRSGRHELLAIAACLQLVTAGAPMVKQLGLGMRVSLDDIVQALEKLKEDKVIQHPRGVRLLETTISLAKNKFAESISPAESWTFLFTDDVPLAYSPSARSSPNSGSIRNGASALSINPKRQFHSVSWASGGLSALPGSHHRPISSTVNQRTTHCAPRSIRSTSGRHIPNVRRHPHTTIGRSSFWIGGAGIQGSGLVKALRFIL